MIIDGFEMILAHERAQVWRRVDFSYFDNGAHALRLWD